MRLRAAAPTILGVAAAVVAGCTSGGAAPAGPAARALLRPSPRPARGEVTLAVAGDVHFAGRVAVRLTGRPADVLGPIGTTLAGADLAIVNLETAVTKRGTPEPKQFHFRAPATALTALKAAGVDVVTMANNHAVDYGPVGLADTLAARRAGPLPVVGVGDNAADAFAPFLATVRGTRVAIIAASQIHDRTAAAWSAGAATAGIATAFDLDRMVAAVRAARDRADVVVVYLHWGTEGSACPNSEQRVLARRLAQAGAAAVVGTHAHLPLGSGWEGRTYVAYGLGNFLWWRDDAYSNDTGVLTLRLQGGAVVAADLTPARIDSAGVPIPAAGAAAARIRTDFAGPRGCTGLAAAPPGPVGAGG